MYRVMKETTRTHKTLDGVTITCPDVTRYSIVDMTEGTPRHVSYVEIRPEQVDSLDEAVRKVGVSDEKGQDVWTVGSTADEDVRVACDLSIGLTRAVLKVVRGSGQMALVHSTDDSLWLRNTMRQSMVCTDGGTRRYKCTE